MIKKTLRVVAVLGLLVIPLLFVVQVGAIANPDSTPTVSNLHVNRNLMETGDVLFYGDYNIPYASLPDEPASSAFVFRLMNGTTELGSITPYVLMDNGYNEGVFSFYFAASAAPTWGTSYTVRISQNPAVFTTPTSTDYVLPVSAYTSSTTQEANQSQLAINIISAAQRLQTAHSTYTFLDTGSAGTVLSSPTGETYFRGSIYGVQAMAPSLFLVQSLEIASSRTYATTQFDTYGNRFDGTWVGASQNATATQFGMTPTMVMGMIIILPLCVGAIVLSSIKYRKTEPGLVVSAVLILMGGLMGWIAIPLFASIYQAMGIYLSYVWFYARG